jgi:hypothetical protein
MMHLLCKTSQRVRLNLEKAHCLVEENVIENVLPTVGESEVVGKTSTGVDRIKIGLISKLGAHVQEQSISVDLVMAILIQVEALTVIIGEHASLCVLDEVRENLFGLEAREESTNRVLGITREDGVPVHQVTTSISDLENSAGAKFSGGDSAVRVAVDIALDLLCQGKAPTIVGGEGDLKLWVALPARENNGIEHFLGHRFLGTICNVDGGGTKGVTGVDSGALVNLEVEHGLRDSAGGEAVFVVESLLGSRKVRSFHHAVTTRSVLGVALGGSREERGSSKGKLRFATAGSRAEVATRDGSGDHGNKVAGW